MQSQDELGNIKQLVQVNFDDPVDFVGKLKAATEKGATSHAIGTLPQKDETVLVNGLRYRVDFADFVKGKFTIKLICRDK